MTTQAVLDALRKHPFVQGFEAPQVDKLAALAKEVRFDPDQIIFREGDECSEFYLIVSGRVGLEIAAPNRTFRVETLAAGDELGWSAILAGKGKHFQARVLAPVEALAFEGPDLMALCRADPALGLNLMIALLGVVSERLQFTRLQVLDTYWPAAKMAGA
jgi:CRP/FNR family cyclic AMP-dependent transcriptional regulator